MVNDAEKTLSDAIDHFLDIINNHDRIIKIIPPFEHRYIRQIQKASAKNQEALANLSFHGFEINGSVINEIKKINAETAMSFSQACNYYMNKKIKELERSSNA